MANQNQIPNRTDQKASEFFHSKTWKIILTIWISMIGLAVLIVCCFGVSIIFGLGGSFFVFIHSLFH